MKTSEAINELATAYAKAQGEIKDAAFDSVNPHFKSKYASLTAGLIQIRAVFSKNGLSIIQTPFSTDHAYFLSTKILHSSGQWLESELKLILQKNDMQGLGAALTYARRQAAFAFAGIAGDEDLDGAVDMPKPEQRKPTPNPAPKAPTRVNVADQAKPNEAQIKRLYTLANLANWSRDQAKAYMSISFKITSTKDLNLNQYDSFCNLLEQKKTYDDVMFEKQAEPKGMN